jgi:hypothetical protein
MATTSLAVAADAPRTKLESALGRRGRILIKVFHHLGTVSGAYGSSLDLQTLRLFEPGNEANCDDGVTIEVRERDQRTGHSRFLDLDEVESLIAGLEYMSNCVAQAQGYQGDYTEMVFSTRGDFSVGFFLDHGKAQAFVKSSYDQAFVAPQVLLQLASLLRAGQQHLQAARPVKTP